MDVSQGILLDKSLLELQFKSKKEIKMGYFKEDDELSDIVMKTINVEEYEVKNE